MIKCCIFDLDGVVVDTARYHYMAWAQLAHRLGFEFTEADGEATKGVGRMTSLDVVLRVGGQSDRFSLVEKERLAAEKNATYLDLVAHMSPEELLPGVAAFLHELRALGVGVVLGSASKNAATILDRCAIRELFDVVIDGTMVTRAKPDPMIFATGAALAGFDPCACVVFEDAAAGIEAATRAGMRSVGVGGSPTLSAATMQLASFEGFTFAQLCKTIC
ncbi:MAG: beta-phosphoglucomutase [Alistipes sp.]